MPSITLMMSAIFLDDVAMSPIVRTTLLTASPPCCALAAASLDSWRACVELLALILTVLDNSSIDDAVCWMLDAWRSVRLDRSALPEAISPAALARLSLPLRTLETTVTRLSVIAFSALSSWPVSSFECDVTVTLRSRLATRRAISTAWEIGTVIERVTA